MNLETRRCPEGSSGDSGLCPKKPQGDSHLATVSLRFSGVIEMCFHFLIVKWLKMAKMGDILKS